MFPGGGVGGGGGGGGGGAGLGFGHLMNQKKDRRGDSDSDDDDNGDGAPRDKMPYPSGPAKASSQSLPAPDLDWEGLAAEESNFQPVGFQALEDEDLPEYPEDEWENLSTSSKPSSSRSSSRSKPSSSAHQNGSANANANPDDGDDKHVQWDPNIKPGSGILKRSKDGANNGSRKEKRGPGSQPTQGMSGAGPSKVRVVRAGTVGPVENFSEEADAEALRKAMKGFGCDATAVSKILCRRSNAQRQLIRGRYKSMFGRDLMKDLVSELHGHHEDVCVALCLTPSEFDAVEMRRAVKGAGTSESILIEILASRTNAEIAALKADYKRLYNRRIIKDVESDTSFNFKKLMRSLLAGNRDESGLVDPAKAASDAKALYDAGEGRAGTDETRFNAVLASQGFPQLQLVFREYDALSKKKSLEGAIKSEFSGSIRDGLLAIVKCVRHTPSFFAERLYLSMKGLGTKDRQLLRILVSRAEVDMVQIKDAYQRLFKKSLESWIRDDTSGKYREALILLVQGNQS